LHRPEGVAAARLFVGRSMATWTLPEQIAAELGERILNEDIAPGNRVGEEMLAREFGVSRGPIRDALRMLEQVGLVSIASRKGTVATPLSEGDLREIFALRIGLSEIALLGFAQHVSPENLAHYRRHLHAAENTGEDDRNALIWTEAIDRLILFIAHNCGNSRAARQLTTLSLESIRYVRRALRSGLNPVSRRRQILRFYRELLAAYESGASLEPHVQKMRKLLGERVQTVGALVRQAAAEG
jgi:DNA-binding GntR family transcriptional regulator